ncbi:MAG: hypothetical protein RR035_08560 [Oscillibacter sp.]
MSTACLKNSRRNTGTVPPWRTALTAAVVRHPIVGFTVGMGLMGIGMVTAVSVATALVIFPLALLLGW